MAERLSDEELGDLERLAERAGRHAPLGPWSSEALLRLIAEVRQVRKLFEDAGGDEHNVLALVEHWGDEARAARAELAALKGEREKTREYWELWCGTEHVATYPANDASDAESVRREVYGDKGPGDRVVHVTRWRKR